MYSNKTNVNILTSLLVAHGIRHAVVCPGSRNAPLVHNLSQCPSIVCYPITDERSAGFFALGIAQHTDQPVVVCVTSGTALLNLAPAVAEAHYQHQSLIVLSADRPAAWIGQLDGQTLQQPGALSPWVSVTVDLPDEDAWHCNRLVNEALLSATADHHPCVHINVPIKEPLFDFSVSQLPSQRIIRRYIPAVCSNLLPQPLIDDLLAASRPLVVFGQLSSRRFHNEGVDYLFSHVVVLHESLSPLLGISLVDELLQRLPDDCQQALLPDFILFVGDSIVSKRLKHFLRSATSARTWRISLTGDVEDTFQNLHAIVVGDAERLLQSLSFSLRQQRGFYNRAQASYRREWLMLLTQAQSQVDVCPLSFSEAGAVRLFEQQLQSVDYPFEVHYANSTSVRLANTYAKGHPVWCNRGVNGIEGSLSTAAGFAASMPLDSRVFCVIGDLSFFYDQNALWNQHVDGRLRILLLNNGHGAIFDQLPGLEACPVHDSYVAGRHHASAEGICRQHDVTYLQAADMAQLQQGIATLLQQESRRPVLLEVLIART
ncbi:MAG: 2-succinyl-5-enolpyruvyl-6-hydroxy-3-cyclohexene-1-carboxylic-acid synthase [Prevotella sp.]|nr:2-succinyl-5-enolpyruvyl-6-hydroxy-3-cyclohexene-1-carboxylic-acid synthase [Prevotella sp.]